MVGVISHIFSDIDLNGGNTSVVEPGDWNSAHNIALTMLSNTGGMSAIQASNIFLAGGNNITLSATTDTNTNATLTICGPQISIFEMGMNGTASTTGALSVGSAYFQGFALPTELAVSRLNIYVSQFMSFSALATTTISSTNTFSNATSFNAYIYSRGGGTNTATLYQVTSAQMSLQMSGSVSWSSNSITVSYTLNYPVNLIGNAFSTSNSTATVSSTTVSSAMLAQSNWSSLAEIYFPMQVTLEPGNYYVGLHYSATYSGSRGTSSLASCGPNFDLLFQKQILMNYTFLGGSSIVYPGTSTTKINQPYMGLVLTSTAVFSTTTMLLSILSSNNLGLFPATLMNHALLNE